MRNKRPTGQQGAAGRRHCALKGRHNLDESFGLRKGGQTPIMRGTLRAIQLLVPEPFLSPNSALELAEHFSSVDASQTSPCCDVQIFRNEPDRAVAQKDLNTAYVLAVGRRRDASRRKHA